MKIIKSIIIPIILVFLLAGCSNNTDNINNTNSSINTQRISTNITVDNITPSKEMTIGIIDNQTKNSNNINDTPVTVNYPSPPSEEEISNFTTDILTDDDKRENNIDITCSKINNYTVKSGETFSFTDTVGKATEDKGYQKADIFDAYGNKVKGLGGGNCQVSSTLYNAVLQAGEGFEIVERHEHSESVYYVPDGMDATVAYGSLDFKFKNNNPFDIKIYASTDTETVNVRLVKINT